MGFKQPQQPTGRQVLGSAFWSVVALFVGWTLFFHWWRVVLDETPQQMVKHVLSSVLIAVSAVGVVTLVWIQHNRRLASRGRRNATPFRVHTFIHDHLARPLTLPSRAQLRESSSFVISSENEGKIYRTGSASGDPGA